VTSAKGSEVPGQAWRKAQQGLARCQKFERSGRIDHLTNGILLLREAAFMASDRGEAAIISGNLGTALSRFHELTGMRQALDESIEMSRSALASEYLGLDDVTGWTHGLRRALRTRYDLAGNPADLEEAIAVGALLRRLPSRGRPPATWAAWLSECADDLRQRAESRAAAAGAAADTDAEVALRREAAGIAPADYPDPGGLLANLGTALANRAVLADAAGEPDQAEASLQAALTALRGAATLTTGGPYAFRTFAQLARALAVLAARTGDQAPLDEAIAAARRGRALAPPGEAAAAALVLLVGLIAERGRFGVALIRGAGVDAGTMAAGIRLLREAIAGLDALSGERTGAPRGTVVGATGSGAIEDERLSLQTDLGVALRARYMETSDPADLNEAIDLARAVAGAPRRAADPARHGEDLTRLGISLQTRHRRTGELTDLNEAISALREGTAALPDGDPQRPGDLSSLGLALQLRFAATGHAADLDEAVAAGSAAVAMDALAGEDAGAVPAGDRTSRSGLLSNAGLAYRLRAELTGNVDDLEEAVRLAKSAVDAAGADSAARADTLYGLGRALLVRSGRAADGTARPGTPHKDDTDLAAALDALRAAARLSGAPRQTRLSAAVTWALAAAPEAAAGAPGDSHQRDLSAWADAADAYETAIDLLDLVAWHGLPRQARERQLARLPGLAADAAASALASGAVTRALSLLDRGRSVLWTQLLRLRSDLDELRDADHGLHRQLTELGAALASDAGPGPGERGEWRQPLAAEWDATLARARALPGFGNLLRFLPGDELISAGTDAPAVVLNVSAVRSDALLLTGGKATVLPLPGVTPDEVRRRVLAHFAALDAAAGSPHDPLAAEAGEEALLSGLDWIAEHVTGPALDELARTGTLPAVGARVRWCPTGLLGMLPLHAAAHDRVIGSYVSTLSGLTAVHRRTAEAGGQRMLVIAVPEVPGHPGLARLDGAHDEAEFLGQRFPERHTLLEGRDATRRRVLDALPAHALAHFSCHGLQSQVSPDQSALWLHDERLTIADLAELRLSGTLAFLSACDTAAGAVDLPDEAIHLAAAVQVAGFRQVVAALWPIVDDVTADLIVTFYQRLAAPDWIDASRTAAALHAAVDELKARFPRRPSVWGAYAHFGP
jgi:hypothetical protein